MRENGHGRVNDLGVIQFSHMLELNWIRTHSGELYAGLSGAPGASAAIVVSAEVTGLATGSAATVDKWLKLGNGHFEDKEGEKLLGWFGGISLVQWTGFLVWN